MTTQHNAMNNLYSVNLKKIQKGCGENWFGSTSFLYGTTPKTILINENEPLHFVQILFMLKEHSWDDDRWMLFTKQGLQSIVKNNEKIYLENEIMFGKQFVNEFHTQIDFFIKNYCDVIGEY